MDNNFLSAISCITPNNNTGFSNMFVYECRDNKIKISYFCRNPLNSISLVINENNKIELLRHFLDKGRSVDFLYLKDSEWEYIKKNSKHLFVKPKWSFICLNSFDFIGGLVDSNMFFLLDVFKRFIANQNTFTGTIDYSFAEHEFLKKLHLFERIDIDQLNIDQLYSLMVFYLLKYSNPFIDYSLGNVAIKFIKSKNYSKLAKFLYYFPNLFATTTRRFIRDFFRVIKIIFSKSSFENIKSIVYGLVPLFFYESFSMWDKNYKADLIYLFIFLKYDAVPLEVLFMDIWKEV